MPLRTNILKMQRNECKSIPRSKDNFYWSEKIFCSL